MAKWLCGELPWEVPRRVFEPGAVVDANRSAGGDRRLPVRIQPITAAQPVGLSEPGAVRGATRSISGFGRATPSLRRRWTTADGKRKTNQRLRLTHGVVQKSEPGHVHLHDIAATED